MKLPRRTFLHLTAGAAALWGVSRIARAQAYPTRPVRIIAPTGPGGAPDIIARLIGPWLSQRLGQQFIVENRAGSGNNIGTEAVVRGRRTAIRSSSQVRRIPSTRSSTTNSISFFSATSPPSQASSAFLSSWW